MERRTPSEYPSPSCTRGPEEFRPRLYVAPSPRARSVLRLKFPSGATREVLLPARYTRMLLVHVEAWHEDGGNAETFRGVLSNDVIAERLTELSPSPRKKPFDPEAVPVYVYEMKKVISDAVSGLLPDEPGDRPAPVLLENLRSARIPDRSVRTRHRATPAGSNPTHCPSERSR